MPLSKPGLFGALKSRLNLRLYRVWKVDNASPPFLCLVEQFKIGGQVVGARTGEIGFDASEQLLGFDWCLGVLLIHILQKMTRQ